MEKMLNRTLHTIQKLATKQGVTLPSWLSSPDYDPRLLFIFEDRKLVFIEVPKVASRSILRAIGNSYGVNLQPRIRLDPFWQTQRGTLPTHQQAYAKFAFVRNPFARLVSCYKDKILYVRSQNSNNPRPYILQKYIGLDATFADFVNVISEVPDCHADRHFKSQYAILYEGGHLLPDWIGRFETLAGSWAEIAQKYQFEQTLPKPLAKDYPQHTPQDYRAYYTLPVVKKVYKRYKKDIEALGYANAYRELLTFVANK